MTKLTKNLRILDAVYHEAALVDAEEGPDTPELRRDVDAIMAFSQARLAELRREEHRRNAERAPAVVSSTVRPSILAMTRAAILDRLAALWTMQPGTVLAHRAFVEMPDDDLRVALEDAESIAERAR